MNARSTSGIGALVLVLLAVAGCSSGTALAGRGSVVSPSVTSPTGFPSTSSDPSIPPFSNSPPASATVSPSSSAPTSSVPTSKTTSATPAAKVCPLKSNPPFCYGLPAGFRDYSYLKTYGKGWQYRTLISVGQHDLIEVLATRFKNSTDSLDNAQLTKYFDRQVRSKPGRYHVRKAGPVSRIRVDGARSFEQHVVFVDGVHGDTTTVFHGRSIISIGCQSQTQAGRVATACSRVRRSIDVK